MSRIEILLVSLISLGLLSYESDAASMEDAKELDRLPEDIKKPQKASILQINNATFLNAAPMEDAKRKDRLPADNKLQNASIVVNNATFVNGSGTRSRRYVA